jgi:hypothetical protein
MAALPIRARLVAAYGLVVADVEAQPGYPAATDEPAARQKPVVELVSVLSEAC